MQKTIPFLYMIFLVSAFSAKAQKNHSDNGDGTYTNPVIAADFPDPDVILVDSTYYMVSTTMFVFPGVTILKSKDLVNWEYCSNTVSRFDFGKCYDLDSCDRYGGGQWATSIKYHNGKFYLIFITMNEGGFMCTAYKPEGPWKLTHLTSGFYDPGLFFDDNGRIYVAHGQGDIKITEVNDSMVPLQNDSIVFKGDIRYGLEGTHMYKINGYYYLYNTYGSVDGIQVALRSKDIYGPYEEKIVIKENTPGINFGIHQGALIQTPTGQWWTLLFVDRGPLGRFPSLQPVEWADGWPMVGIKGKAVTIYQKPDIGKNYPIQTLPVSDEFNSKSLGLQWGWNHNPDSANWSLTQRPGYLRLTTAKIVSDLSQARNTLTQRIFANYPDSVPTVGTTKIDIEKMKEGDIAGLGIFQNPHAFIAAKRMKGYALIVMVNNGVDIDSVTIDKKIVYLRTIVLSNTGKASFEYSFDDKKFTSLGNILSMRFSLSVFTGNKFCLFNYATKTLGGSVDIDWFRSTKF